MDLEKRQPKLDMEKPRSKKAQIMTLIMMELTQKVTTMRILNSCITQKLYFYYSWIKIVCIQNFVHLFS